MEGLKNHPFLMTPPQPGLNTTNRQFAFFATVMLCAVALVVLPREIAAYVFGGLIALTVIYGTGDTLRKHRHNLPDFRDFIFKKETVKAKPVPVIPAWLRRLMPILILAELSIITGAAWSVTQPYHENNPGTAVLGPEGEWLTSSAYFASNSLRDYGYIPLWQPYLEYGEPLYNNPFSFPLNPFSTIPALLLGGVTGIKLSVVIHVLLAGYGGWVLGRVLGFGSAGRVLLGLLMVGKGNMFAMIGAGYYQLGVTQAYFPWIIAGTIAVLRTKSRWPMVLTAISYTFMFWGGNIWYTLPMLLSMVTLAAFHIFYYDGQRIHKDNLRRF
ncbi:MAG TPA: hypothetical protein VJZ27_18770, partial [Aggregatilineales bacterium]|nr:hypothetical protein [Aggregatilineales bacterium]